MRPPNGPGSPGVKGPSRSLRILVILRAVNMDRVTEGLLRCVLEGGHAVHVAVENHKDRAGRATDEDCLFDVLENEYPDFSWGVLRPREEPWLYPATRLRSAIDFLRYFAPAFAAAENLRERARSRAPWYARLPAALGLLRVGPLRRSMNRFLRAVERRMPVAEQSLALLREFEPDLLLVSPLVEIGSPQGDHLRAADRVGIPTALVVASWDNLTTKGVIRDAPDLTIVWNEDQIREAVAFHGLPAESVVATGAHSHDHWFTWQPSTTAEQFAAKVGLAEDRPFLLYVCSSGFIAGDDEVDFVREWARRLGASGDPELERLGMLVRPHPQNFACWQEAELEEPGRIVVWPRGGVAPTDRQSKEGYFDSLHHARAVVGINTTALVDSAIVRRPVFTMIGDQFRSTQTGTLHFSYLASDEGNGLLNVAHSWDEHFDQLGAAMRAGDRHRRQIEDFLWTFVRPHGPGQPAAPLALDAIQVVASHEKAPAVQRGPIRWTVGAIAGALGRLHLLRERVLRYAMRKRKQRLRKKRRAARASMRQARRAGKPAKPGKPGKAPPAGEPDKDDRRQKVSQPG